MELNGIKLIRKIFIVIIVSFLVVEVIDYSREEKLDRNVTSLKAINHFNFENTAQARGKIKMGRELRNKARQNGRVKSTGKYRNGRKTIKHTPSKKHKGGKKQEDLTKRGNK
ncbi:hypothetical protein MUA26_04135 [Staphylococcus sp. IVB6246]|uniref:hypothetical protein n=1 Tax=Staphylococcus sp. IVB6246 TaxID=2989772 RepID=UPI0021D0BA0D|nr:hypothetical protein [Staphylococcus sp. IVB6246]UXR70325.1 hypothetical protein MUA26_04135 [Staphylococcus sp. IVB6246]